MAQVLRAATEPGVGGRRPPACAGLEIVDDLDQGDWQVEVRNTFLHGRLARSPSLEPFYREREVSSCPGCKSGCLEGLFLEEDADAATVHDQSGHSDGTTETPALSPRSGWSEAEWCCAAAQHGLAWQGPPPAAAAGPPPAPLQPPVIVHVPAAVPSAPCAGRTLVRLADSLLADAAGPPGCPPLDLRRAAAPRSPPEAAAPGSEELPSVGSANHGIGRCKPCAFVHSKGCADGPMCQFCHLCDPGEKKRRQREKLKFRKAAFRVRRGATAAF